MNDSLKLALLMERLHQKALFYFKFFSIIFFFGFVWFILQKNNLLIKYFRKEYLLYNLILAILLTMLYFAFLKFKKEGTTIFLTFLISTLFFLVPLKRNLSLCGDASEWIWISTKNWIHGSEILSNFSHYVFQKLMLQFGVVPARSFGYLSSLFGILYLLSLYILTKTLFKDLTKRYFFFVLSISISSTGFFVHYPENTFLALPFLIFALNHSIKYFNCKNGYLKHLCLYSLFFVIACLFHGFALFAFPFFAILPFLKKNYKIAIFDLLIFISFFIFLVFFTWNILKFLGFLIHPHHARIFKGSTYPFVDAFNQAKFYNLKIPFFSKIHISSILFSIFLSSPFAFFILPFTLFGKEISYDEILLWLMAFSQLIFIVFWNPDLGIWRDIDLFLTPSFFISLVYLYFSVRFIHKNCKVAPVFLSFASVLSGIPYIILG